MNFVGASDLDIFPLVLGGNTFGWTSGEEESHEVLSAFVAEGGTMIDTADGYSHWVPGHTGGESELILGSWLAGRDDRDDLVIATKAGSHPEHRGLSARAVKAAAEASLARLGIDTIDLYYAHRDDPAVPLEETVRAFGDLVQSGKVRYIGLSNFSPERVREWLRLSAELGVPRPVALQPHYNLVARSPYEDGVAPLARSEGLGVLPHSALASGFLSGKYRSAADAVGAERAARVSRFFSPAGLAVLDELHRIGSRLGEEPASVALAWLRSRGEVTAPIASARTVVQLTSLLAGARLELNREDVRALNEASAKLGRTQSAGAQSTDTQAEDAPPEDAP
ncbi:oxidoreductase [Zafaria cholistanensis]|uniref:Oxidoreductase n=1 Tax=Zafaria cholistanensis TaxID=1682741 RepID=A0A5A7NUJ0_9MICC|nr:aldo/keto reductase [Zafaria cholistanensis]GER24399.1 oxidoreductase [Zafaria cholistanensis]